MNGETMNDLRAIVIGRSIGVRDLNALIQAVELEDGNTPALKAAKHKLRCKGSRSAVLAFARECLAAVMDW